MIVDSHGRPIGKNGEHLPFKPETLPEARQRYEDAVEKIWNVTRIEMGAEEEPDQVRDHVFDFKSGLRIIIFTGYAPLAEPDHRGPFEHVTGTFFPERLNLVKGRSPFEEFHRVYLYMSRVTFEDLEVKRKWMGKTGRSINYLFDRPDRLQEAIDQIQRGYPGA